MMAKIQLDMAGDVVDNDIVFDDDTKLSDCVDNLKITIINENGPGGGWPIVELEGDREDIIKYLDTHYCVDGDVDFYVDELLED
ncbi:hypothetical protein [Serratia phage SP1]|nr:hypothetical protein [Serratia phage SP1]